MTDKERIWKLEELLDSYGDPAALLEGIAAIASEKADHVRSITGMQDIELGKLWDRVATFFDATAQRYEKKLDNPYGGGAK